MAAAKKLKKAQEGTELRKGQYKRIGRISEKNPERAERVAERMNTRASRVDRGKEIANPSKMERNPMNEMRESNRMMDMNKYKMLENVNIYAPRPKKEEMKQGGVVKKKMQSGGTLKTPAADQKGLKKLPTPVRNKMGFKKMGGSVSKKK
jgi:hypothetical protein